MTDRLCKAVKAKSVPVVGWQWAGISDSGASTVICEICGKHIRYVHHMSHPDYRPMKVGCLCAGKLEGDIDLAKQREREFINKQNRYERFKKIEWKESVDGKRQVRIRNHLVTAFQKDSQWEFSIDNLCTKEKYCYYEEIIMAAFEALESVTNKK